jgi:beta-barrel assembly-enhancing protease
MKRIVYTSMLLSFMLSGCKEVTIPEMNIGGFNTKNIQTAVNIGTKVYDATEEITPEQEYYIGRSVAASVLGKYKLYSPKELNDYVNSVGQVLVANSLKPETFNGYHFAVLDNDEINAFATPSGFIFISRGLLKMCNNEDELAAILAHEISHVQLQHGIGSIKDSRWTSVATLLGTEAVKQYGAKELATLTQSFEGSINDIIHTMVVNGYSREYELAADAYALEMLRKTGYYENAIVQMLQKMHTVLKDDSRGFGSTHPKANDRIEAISPLLKNNHTVIEPSRTQRFQKFMKNV